MDVYELLKQDHQEAMQLFSKINQTTAVNARAKLFYTLKDALEVHTKIEETHLYPALRDNQGTRPLVEESLTEHQKAASMLEELARSPMDHEDWIRKCAQLQQDVEHHAQEEEQELFPKAQQILSVEKAKAMAERMKEQREELMTKA